jgi:hypothetical protein
MVLDLSFHRTEAEKLFKKGFKSCFFEIQEATNTISACTIILYNPDKKLGRPFIKKYSSVDELDEIKTLYTQEIGFTELPEKIPLLSNGRFDGEKDEKLLPKKGKHSKLYEQKHDNLLSIISKATSWPHLGD